MKRTSAQTSPVASHPLSPGGWFLREGQLFQITQWDIKRPLQIEARVAGVVGADGAADMANNNNNDDDARVSFALTDLFAAAPVTRFAATAEELTHATTHSNSQAVVDATLPDHLLNRADALIKTVEAVAAHIKLVVSHQHLSLTEATRQACQSLDAPVGLTCYYKYRGLYEQHGGDRTRIAAALRRDTFGKTQIQPAAQHFIDAVIQRFYRSNPPLRAHTVYAIAEQLWLHNRHWWIDPKSAQDPIADTLIHQLLDARTSIDDLVANTAHRPMLMQIKLPSRAWFYGYTRWIGSQSEQDGAQIYITRHGQAEWDAHYRVFDQFADAATLPLQHVFADHHKLDVLHVDDEFRQELGRLWLTVLIDAFSRCVLGVYLAYESPCIESIQGALRHAIWPKSGLDIFGIEQPWMTFGIPQRLSLDNAWAHHSYSLEDLARALAHAGQYTHMELVFRPPYQARYGGLVERVFGNLSGQIRERLPGAILKPDQRHWHNASQGACLLYGDIQRVIYQLVVDYMHTPHRELSGQTPHQRWLAGMQLMTPVPPPLTPQLERQFWRLFPSTRKATGTGLSLFGLRYWDANLKELRAYDKRGQQRQFGLRYDPADISRVAVFESGRWLGDAFARELRMPDGHFETTSLWELDIAKKLVRSQTGRCPRKTHSWLIHLLEARELVAQRQSEQKAIRRKVQQLREQRRGRPKRQLDLCLSTASATAPAPAPAAAPTAAAAAATTVSGAKAKHRSDHRSDPRVRLLESLAEVL